MKKYLNKALLYKEWKTCKWFLLIFTVINLFFVQFMNMKTEQLRENAKFSRFFITNYYNLWMMIFIPLVVYASILVGEEYSGKKYEIFTTMPCTREEIVLNKWFMGIMTFLIPLLLSYIMININFALNKDMLKGIITYNILFQMLIFNVLEFVFVFTFIMLIELLIGKNILGGIIGAIFLFLPLGFSTLVHMSTRFLQYTSFGNGLYKYLEEHLDIIAFNISLVFYNCMESYGIYGFSSRVFRMLILIAAIVICLLLSVYAFKKYSLENMGFVVAFERLELIFKLGVSICFGLLFSSIYSGWQSDALLLATRSIDTGTADKYMIFTILVAVIGGIATYFIVNKIIEANKK